jgi:hypothetical protein
MGATRAVVAGLSLSLIVSCDGAPERDSTEVLVPRVASCIEGDGAARVKVRFGGSSKTPESLSGRVDLLTLRGYSYALHGTDLDEVNHVGGLPTLPGTIELDPTPDRRDVAVDAPPPAAELEIMSGESSVVFSDLLLGQPSLVHLAAGDVEALEGMTAETPLGQVTVTDARYENGNALIELEHGWSVDMTSRDGFQPKGSILSSFSWGSFQPVGSLPSYVPDRSYSQDLEFSVGSRRAPTHVTLSLLEFGFVVDGPITLDDLGSACGH